MNKLGAGQLVAFSGLLLFLAACEMDNGGTPQTNQPPTVTLTATPQSGPAPLATTISAVATDPEGDPLTYQWNLEGAAATPTIAYTFAEAGTYPVTVTVSDGQNTANASTSVTVTEGTDVPTPPTNPPTNPTPPETPPTDPKPAKPTINSFRALQDTVEAGGTVGLQWSVTGADTLSIDNGVGTVTGTSVVVTVDQTTTYKLTATNKGGSVSKSVRVKVESPADNVSFYGRWIVTFKSNPADGSVVVFVHELDIYKSEEGKQLFCHYGLTGALCSSFKEATGTGHIGGSASDNSLGLGLDTFSEAERGGDRFLGSDGGLTPSKTADGNQRLSGKAFYVINEEYFDGTVEAVNVGDPRTLK